MKTTIEELTRKAEEFLKAFKAETADRPANVNVYQGTDGSFLFVATNGCQTSMTTWTPKPIDPTAPTAPNASDINMQLPQLAAPPGTVFYAGGTFVTLSILPQ